MADRGMTRREFGLRVRSHPGGAGDHRRQQDAQWHADDRLVFRRYQLRPSRLTETPDVNRKNHERYSSFVSISRLVRPIYGHR